MLERIKRMLDIDEADTDLDDKLTDIRELVEARLCVRLGGVDEVPPELDYIVTEVTVARFNRIGSEGMSSHSVSTESASFADDDFDQFADDIQAYLDSQKDTVRGKVRFL